jgi:hypothetical protein
MKEVGVGWDDVVRRTIYTLRPTDYEVITAAIDEVTGGAGSSGADDRRYHRACRARLPDRDRVHGLGHLTSETRCRWSASSS